MRRDDLSRMVATSIVLHVQFYGGDPKRQVLLADQRTREEAEKIAAMVVEDTGYFKPRIELQPDLSWSVWLVKSTGVDKPKR
jgi:hypothetical protein